MRNIQGDPHLSSLIQISRRDSLTAHHVSAFDSSGLGSTSYSHPALVPNTVDPLLTNPVSDSRDPFPANNSIFPGKTGAHLSQDIRHLVDLGNNALATVAGGSQGNANENDDKSINLASTYPALDASLGQLPVWAGQQMLGDLHSWFD